jgi:hypothetical protein
LTRLRGHSRFGEAEARVSIFFARVFRRGWIAGSSPLLSGSLAA